MTSRTWHCEISKNLTWNSTLTAKNTPLFLFPYMGHSLQIFAWGMPRHAHVFSFTHNAVVLRILDVFTPKIRRKFLILTFLWIKTSVAYTRLEVIAKQRSALQVEFITGVKLICYFVLYFCFLQWDHLPNMAVGDLAFYYTLYIYDQTKTVKEVFSDSNNIILWHESEDINKKSLFPKFQLILSLRFEVMHDHVYFIAPIDYCVE